MTCADAPICIGRSSRPPPEPFEAVPRRLASIGSRSSDARDQPMAQWGRPIYDRAVAQGGTVGVGRSTAIVLFTDLVGSSELRSRLGEDALTAGCVSTWRQAQIEEHLEGRSSSSWGETREGQADALYAPYVARQQREWEVVQRDSRVWISAELDFAGIPGLSNEMVE